MTELKLEKIHKERNGKLTPMMEQYLSLKKNHRNDIVFFRMGDFYEVFFEDAHKTSKILNIALTHRGKIGDHPIPMAGIPHHAAATYIDRITQAGEKVAICEQIEDPKAAKGIVKRAVTQVVSPGLPYDLEKSEENQNHFIMSFFEQNKNFHVCFIDFTTGDFFGLVEDSLEGLIDKIKTNSPKECIAYFDQFEKYPELKLYLENLNVLTTFVSMEYFETKYTDFFIEKVIPFYKEDQTLQSEPSFLSPIGALAYYLNTTQTEEVFSHFKPFRFENTSHKMKISHQTLTALEILPRSIEKQSSSLLHLINKTKSSMGFRKLKEITQEPLYDRSAIQERLDTVQFFLKNESLLDNVRTTLAELRDVPRILAKLSTKKIQGYDLINLARSFEIFFHLNKELKPSSISLLKSNLSSKQTKSIKSLQKLIKEAINDEIGASLLKGNLIKEGYCKERDNFANMSETVEDKIKKLEKKYREEFEIPTLKIKSNNINGFFIEVSKNQSKKVPKEFIKKQTLVNSERFLCPKLEEIENDLIQAKEKLTKVERKIFNKILDQVEKEISSIHQISDWLSLVDVFQSFAWLALQEQFTRPKIVKEKKSLLQGTWHPIIKKNLKNQFVPHQIDLNSKKYFALITGPNMAGKTTVMREVAIIQFLAQIGSYVPATSAEVGLCDYIFSRIGASDDIVGGQSTFMVEMSETSEIIRHASEHSLVILDEIGRGTSTYDGLSIAWSLLEFFVNNIKCITLFSTHYHELIEVVDQIAGAQNFTVKTLNKNGEVQFLYELIEGGATQSFGINVAKLAGLPTPILHRAQQILKNFENQEQNKTSSLGQIDLFPLEGEKESDPTSSGSELEKALDELDINSLTPLQALNKLQELKSEFRVH